MKILFISPRYRGGGAERCARELFLGMRERGHITEMWTAVPEENVPAGVHYVRTFAERLLYPVNYIDPVADWRHISTRRKLDAIQPGDFDVVHLHNIHGHWISIKALHRLCQRLPVVWTLHDEWAATGGVPYDLSRWPGLNDRLAGYRKRTSSLVPLTTGEPVAVRWERFLSANLPPVAAVVSPSEYVLALAAERFNAERTSLHHVPNASRLHGAETAADRATSTESSQVLFIAANPMSPYKGGDFAIAALQKLEAQAGPDAFRLLILGRQAEEFQQLLPRTISCQAGYANSEAELLSAYQNSAVTLLPSIAENYPYVALESLRAGTPVVGFRIGGLPEIIRNSTQGELVTPFNTTELAEGLFRFLNRAKSETPEQHAMRAGLSDFPEFLSRMEELYQHHAVPLEERCVSGSVA